MSRLQTVFFVSALSLVQVACEAPERDPITAQANRETAATAGAASEELSHNSVDGTPAAAGDATPPETDAFVAVREFVAHCVLNDARIDRLELMADRGRYEPLDADLAAIVAPLDADADWRGWRLPTNEGVLLIGAWSRGMVPFRGSSRSARSCSVASPFASGIEVRRELVQVMNLDRPASESEEAGHIYTVWTHSEPDALIHFTALSPRYGGEGATLSYMIYE